ncbi:MAG: hypothetical protein KUA43_16785 [Hoeflea sp.]|uniref:hypothetical protein n=1 Tax=Hoeflea sp. TaxID=1940281 RepID=UPI001D53B9E1|nr:hypothetical protein [Hoeflea sp.]MBU4531820.1 hypothetical protein [Alphaproteobacteria bacterium]MBU4544676.1 hypothetical protein [Alphaproteobacteria bacterium]MBU4552907.1 hypothetical protein [Alphaproteobacteria bacterium]MBV1725096.1 hypothetical protein [Hoeflea sp.]MBV1761116.1 hypothetical protein [Hoeflea sp.]
MRKLVAVLLGLGLVAAAFAGLALAVVLGVLTASIVAVARMTGRLQPAMVRTAKADGRGADGAPRHYRVWNDGRGTIIDM